jgi:hypothetical protein
MPNYRPTSTYPMRWWHGKRRLESSVAVKACEKWRWLDDRQRWQSTTAIGECVCLCVVCGVGGGYMLGNKIPYANTLCIHGSLYMVWARPK